MHVPLPCVTFSIGYALLPYITFAVGQALHHLFDGALCPIVDRIYLYVAFSIESCITFFR